MTIEMIFPALLGVTCFAFVYFKESIADHLNDQASELELQKLALEQKHQAEVASARRLYDLRIAMRYLPQMLKQGMVSNISINQDKGMQLVANHFTTKLIERELDKGNEGWLSAWEYAKENNYKILSK